MLRNWFRASTNVNSFMKEAQEFLFMKEKWLLSGFTQNGRGYAQWDVRHHFYSNSFIGLFTIFSTIFSKNSMQLEAANILCWVWISSL